MDQPLPSATDIIIYRVREQGLEVFLLPPGTPLSPEDVQVSPLLHTNDTQSCERLLDTAASIALDPVKGVDGIARQAIAIEADWHEIPSLRALMYEDYRVAKEKAKQHLLSIIPDTSKGAYVAVKEAFKRVMPEQYAFLKELKDIVTEKNQTKYV
jgi:hypothetical protein